MKFMPSGDRAMVVEFGNEISTGVNNQVHALAERIKREHVPGVLELVPTFRSLMVYYDPWQTSYPKLRDTFLRSGGLGESAGGRKKRILKIPCCYGAECR